MSKKAKKSSSARNASPALRMLAINKRHKEIRQEMTEAEQVEEIEALTEESETLAEEAAELIDELIANLDEAIMVAEEGEGGEGDPDPDDEGEGRGKHAARTALVNAVLNGKEGEVRSLGAFAVSGGKPAEKTPEARKAEVKSAFAKQILRKKLSDGEARALGVALTTTSNTFVAPSESVDGVNNGGVFIPEEIMPDILDQMELESPIMSDIAMTYIKGMVVFPYAVASSGAERVTEGIPTPDESNEYALLDLKLGNYSKTIAVTFEIEAMAPAYFADYLIREIGIAMRELIAADAIYGTGNENAIKGVTIGAISHPYNAGTDALAAIGNALKKIPKRKRAGIKIYAALDIETEIMFAKDDNGALIYPGVINNGAGGVTRLGTTEMVFDPMLNAGDFIIGNIPRWYKANVTKAMELYRDTSGKRRINEYTAHMMIAGAPVPDSFVHGKVQSGN